MRTKDRYMNGQSRGGTPGVATDTSKPTGRHKKDYHRQEVAFHGGEMAYDKWVKNGRKGYGN